MVYLSTKRFTMSKVWRFCVQMADIMEYNFGSLGYERVYLPFCEVADTPFHIEENGI